MNQMLYILIAELVLLFEPSDGFMSLIPVLDKIVSKYNNKTALLSYVFENPHNITHQIVSFDIDMVRELKDMKLRVAYHFVLPNCNTKLLIERTVDSRRPTMDRFIKLVYDHMKRNNRLPAGCPIPAELFYMPKIPL